MSYGNRTQPDSRESGDEASHTDGLCIEMVINY